jgi:hypothetical protein
MAKEKISEFADLQDSYEFTLEQQEVPVKIYDKEHDEEKWYIIREFTAKERDAWLNDVSGRMRTSEAGNVTGVKNFTGMQGMLLTLTMTHADCESSKDGDTIISNGKKVDMNTVQKWPARLQTRLFELAQRICGLDDEAQERAKNE